jgi:uncharacterized protein (TIGR01319 family)
MIAAAIDIGSTWTKGALFDVGQQDLDLLARTVCPTTPANLLQGFMQALQQLLGGTDALQRVRCGEVHLSYSSSAKGGLSVAALGLVPEITLESARVAAYSAGARVSQVFSYRLTSADIHTLEKSPPDILLFAGGTDGGHSAHGRANARLLAESQLACSIVYAGNRALQDEVSALLAHKDLLLVDNLLPTLDQPNPEPARAALRAIFLSRIVKGKGLDQIIDLTGAQPLPTPYAVYEYAREIQQRVAGWSDFLLLDMGGATTDIYSAHRQSPAPGVVAHGLPEPLLKRSVEGDLGLRVSASAASETAQALISAHLQHQPDQLAAFAAHIRRIEQQPDYLPTDAAGQQFDHILAGACVAHAAARHAGRANQVYTPDGGVTVQTGRDLSQVKKVIGSGGWLSNVTDFDLGAWLKPQRVDAQGKTVLLPDAVEYYRDQHYLFPLLANLARDFPAAAANAGIRLLTQS